MPDNLSERIDLPSAYLVYAVGNRLRRKLQLSPGSASFRTDLYKSAAFVLDLAEITVLIKENLNASAYSYCFQAFSLTV
jgi:hypothetical protein